MRDIGTLSVAGASKAAGLGEGEGAYEEGSRAQDVLAVWGTRGSGAGPFNSLRNAALAPDRPPISCAVYALDSGHRRIQAFTVDGKFVISWGHACKV